MRCFPRKKGDISDRLFQIFENFRKFSSKMKNEFFISEASFLCCFFEIQRTRSNPQQGTRLFPRKKRKKREEETGRERERARERAERERARRERAERERERERERRSYERVGEERWSYCPYKCTRTSSRFFFLCSLGFHLDQPERRG